MCYGVKARTEMSLRIAKSRGNKEAVEHLTQLLAPFPELDLHYANAFTHPKLVVYTSDLPEEPQLMTWGLTPSWVKDAGQRDKLWNQTLNARGETIFEKPAFRSAAKKGRCLVFVEGFYEHHHFGKRTYPYFIRLKHRDHFALAGLWESWHGEEAGPRELTFSIVTTEGNDLLARIHNNPKLKGPRMPVILTEEEEAQWLSPFQDPKDEQALLKLIKPYPADAMEAHTVRPLLGKEGLGNTEKASEQFEYPELLLADPLA
ncbi:MAG: SOS response-associated peptidase [Flavobacteriales bacterium]|jgi:putative SOS response-associated peptidase YedK|nr:SOS response-associated peptidase [Flavobacteriales bacterium]